MVEVVNKRGRGRPKLSAEEKAANAEAKKAAGASAKPPKAAAAPKEPKAPKRTIKSVDHDRVRIEDLNDDQHLGLMLQHAGKIASAETRLKAAQDEVKKARDLARGELGVGALHEIKLYARLQTEEGQETLRKSVEMQARIARWSGMPTGHIEDLFPTEDRATAHEKAFDAGKRAGLAGEDRRPPKHLPGEAAQHWLRGHGEGQEVLAAGFKPMNSVPMPNEAFDSMSQNETDVAVGPALDQMANEYSKPTRDYRSEGAAAFSRGEPGAIPANIPEKEWDTWISGWDNASKAAGMKPGLHLVPARSH